MSLLLTAKIYEAVVNPATDWTICQEHYKKAAFSWEGFLQLTWSILLALPLIGRRLNTLEYQYAIKHYRKPETETQVKTDRVSKEIVGEIKPTKDTKDINKIDPLPTQQIVEVPKQPTIEVRKDPEQQDVNQTNVQEENKPTDEVIISNNSTTQTPPPKEDEKIQPTQDEIVSSDPDFIKRKKEALDHYEKRKKFNSSQEGMQYYSYLYSNKIQEAEFQDDREVALAAIDSSGENLKYLSERLKNDKEIVKLAVSKWGEAVQYITSKELRDDIEIAKLAVSHRHGGNALQYLGQHRGNRDIVLLAVSNSGVALEHAAPKFQNDKEIVLKAVENYPPAYAHASEKLKEDLDVVKAAVSKRGSLLKDVSQQFKENDEIVWLALSNHGEALRYAPKYQDNKDYVLQAISNEPRAFSYASPNLKNNKEVVKTVVLKQPYLFMEASDTLKKDETFILETAGEINEKLASNTHEFLEQIAPSFWSKKPFVLKAVELCPNALQYASKDLKEDISVLTTAATGIKDVRMFTNLNKEILKDKNFVLLALASINKQKAFEAVDQRFWEDKDFVLKAMQINGRCFIWFYDDLDKTLRNDIEVITTAKNSIINELKELRDRSGSGEQKIANARLVRVEIEKLRDDDKYFAEGGIKLAFADEIEKALIKYSNGQKDLHFHFE